MKRIALFVGTLFVFAFSTTSAIPATVFAIRDSSTPVVMSPVVTSPAAATNACDRSNSFFAFPTWYKYLPLDSNCEVKSDGLGGEVVLLVSMAIIEILLFLAGFLAGFMIIYGAFKFILSQGESSKVISARSVIANAVTGLIIAVVASRVVSFIAARLATNATQNTSANGALSGANIPQSVANAASIQNLLGFVFALAGAIALLIITVAGFHFVTSQGEPQKIANARMTVLYALVGLVISVFAFTIVKFVLGSA